MDFNLINITIILVAGIIGGIVINYMMDESKMDYSAMGNSIFLFIGAGVIFYAIVFGVISILSSF